VAMRQFPSVKDLCNLGPPPILLSGCEARSEFVSTQVRDN